MPLTPPTMTPTVVISPFNEVVVKRPRLRLTADVQRFPYALQLLTEAPLPLKIRVTAVGFKKIEVPSASIALSALAPSVSTGVALTPGAVTITLAPTAPMVSGGASVAVPLTSIALTGLAPVAVGKLDTRVLPPAAAITLAALPPTIDTGTQGPTVFLFPADSLYLFEQF